MSPEDLIGMLAELERIRELTLDLIERESPAVAARPRRTRPAGPSGRYSTSFSAHAARCSATPRRPAVCTTCSSPRAAATRTHPTGRELRDALATSEAVENLRRVWETVSLNVLDGPAAPGAAPDAWAELLADAVIGHGLDDSVLARLRPEGFA